MELDKKSAAEQSEQRDRKIAKLESENLEIAKLKSRIQMLEDQIASFASLDPSSVSRPATAVSMDAELTRLRAEMQALGEENEMLHVRVDNLQKALEERSLLVEKLEQDLMSAHLVVSNPGISSFDLSRNLGDIFDRSSTLSSHSASNSISYFEGQSVLPAILQSENTSVVPPSAPSTTTTTAAAADTGVSSEMLRIVAAQRDRFRGQLSEMQEQNANMRAQTSRLESEVERLKNDNIKLYEKIRFLQQHSRSSSGSMMGNSSGSLVISRSTGAYSGGDIEDNYRRLYEESNNPFTLFHKKQQQQLYKDLNPIEKIILTTSRLFLSNKYTRFFLFLYLVCLHALVFFIMYAMAHRQK